MRHSATFARRQHTAGILVILLSVMSMKQPGRGCRAVHRLSVSVQRVLRQVQAGTASATATSRRYKHSPPNDTDALTLSAMKLTRQ